MHFELYNEIEIGNREEFDKIMFGGGVNLKHLIEHKNLTPRFKYKFNFDEWLIQSLSEDQPLMCQIKFLDSGVLENISTSSSNDRDLEKVLYIPLNYSTDKGEDLNIDIDLEIFNTFLKFGPLVYGGLSKLFFIHFTFKCEHSSLEVVSKHELSKEGDKFKIRTLHL